jgi:short-subunit dehydrogenase
MATATKEQEAPAADKSDAKLAIVTGASAGIGREFTRQLARKGYGLVLVARRLGVLEELAADLAARYGVETDVLSADLTTSDGVAAVATRLAAGDVDMLVNSAGFGTIGEFHGLAPEREMDEIDLNIKALVSLTHAALIPMVEKGGGTVINLASLGAFQPCPYMATYVATKAFVLHFSESVHEEVRGYGVTVTALCPGFVATEFQQASGVDLEEMRTFGLQTPKQVVYAALKGAADGRAIVVPGALNGIMSQTSRITPRFLTRRVSGSFFKEQATKKG